MVWIWIFVNFVIVFLRFFKKHRIMRYWHDRFNFSIFYKHSNGLNISFYKCHSCIFKILVRHWIMRCCNFFDFSICLFKLSFLVVILIVKIGRRYLTCTNNWIWKKKLSDMYNYFDQSPVNQEDVSGYSMFQVYPLSWQLTFKLFTTKYRVEKQYV